MIKRINDFIKRFPLLQSNPRNTRILLILAVIVLVVFPQIKFAQNAFWVRVIGYTGLYIILGLGLNVVVGFAGLLDLGYVAFYAIGAYTFALLASGQFDIHLSFWLILPLAGILAALSGVLLGIPVLRMRGDYLAIVTLGFGEIIRILITNLKDITSGSQGLIDLDTPMLFSFELKTGTHFYYLILIFLVILVFFTTRLNNSKIGRTWAALREDEDVAQMMGVNTVRAKLLAFGVGALIGGLGGAIFAAWQNSIFPDNFNLFVSINVLCLVIIGGMGSIPGVIVGSIALITLPDILRQFSDYRILLFGLLLVIMMIARPSGFLPARRPKLEFHNHLDERTAEPDESMEMEQ
jgi:branched-chain amino acid transport system permease protein